MRIHHQKIDQSGTALSFQQLSEKLRVFKPISEIQRPLRSGSSFHQQCLVDQQSGHLCIQAPAYELAVPILAVRHGQTNGNIKRQFQGQIDEPDHALNATGRLQVQQGAERVYRILCELLGATLHEMISSGKIVVMHSPLSRAVDTARAFFDYVAEQTGIRLLVGVEKRLSEMDFGLMEGYTLDEVGPDSELYRQALRYRAEDATADWLGTGESYFDVVLRVHEWLEDIHAQYAGKQVLVLAFSHGMTINALRAVVRDPALVDSDGVVTFRQHILENAEACWLGESYHLAGRLFQPELSI